MMDKRRLDYRINLDCKWTKILLGVSINLGLKYMSRLGQLVAMASQLANFGELKKTVWKC